MKVDFKTTQEEFVAYIRDPFNNPQPTDVKQQRMETYRELFFNNIESFLSSNFPVLKTILNETQWFELSQDFFLNHQCSTPHFSEIAEEFLEYLQEQQKNDQDYPFLLELAHYEWVEMALSISKEQAIKNTEQFINQIGNKVISLSPLAWPLAYQYPVHKISPDFLPNTAPENPSFFLVFRDQDDDVNFLEIPAITFRLLQILQEIDTINCNELIAQMVAESAHPQPEVIYQGAMQIITELAEKNIITPALSV